MSFNWKNALSILNAFSSPKQAVNWLLDKGAKKDPQLTSSLKRMINSGEDPSKVLTQMASEGQINLQQLAQIKNYYNVARKLGFKHQIPNDVWIKAEQAIRSGSKTQQKKFTGF